MIVVNTETGEILDAGAAERRAMKISLRLDSIAENYEAVMPMIRQAIDLRDDIALGYRSPGEFVSDRFGQALTKLGVEVRREVVRELTEAGMSTRAIAPVVGISKSQVAADAQVSSTGHLPEVTGIDGKTYTKPAATPPRPAPRRALTDVAFDAIYDLTKSVERVARLADDDRFTQNAEQIAAKHHDDLVRAVESLSRVLDRFPSQER